MLISATKCPEWVSCERLPCFYLSCQCNKIQQIHRLQKYHGRVCLFARIWEASPSKQTNVSDPDLGVTPDFCSIVPKFNISFGAQVALLDELSLLLHDVFERD